MSGKGAKGLIMGKSASKDKDKKKPVSRSSRAGLQVCSSSLLLFHDSVDNICLYMVEKSRESEDVRSPSSIYKR